MAIRRDAFHLRGTIVRRTGIGCRSKYEKSQCQDNEERYSTLATGTE